MMRPAETPLQHRLLEYDGPRRRVWILGQRCHHGATGSLLAGVAFARLIADPARIRAGLARTAPLVALAATGGALMAHDWKDHSIWFERGRGSQS